MQDAENDICNVFPVGPQPTGLRYPVSGAAMTFVPAQA